MRELIFTSGAVFDGHRRREGVAVGVRGARIVALGAPDRVRASLGAGAQEIDLEGGLLLPGFQDAHLHPLTGGIELLTSELSDLSTPEAYLDALAEAARGQAGAGPDEWFRGGGWAVDAFGPQGPTAAQLDRIVPDRPAYLPSADHHDAWVNSRALQLAGITRDTPDPDDGWIVRDAAGEPTGVLREGAQQLVWRHVTTTADFRRRALLRAQAYHHQWGVTAWHDALIGGYASLDDPTDAYLALLDSGELTMQVAASQWWDRRRPSAERDEQVAELVRRRDELAARGLPAGSVKIMADGITETLTAALTDPWLDVGGCPCGDRGLAFLDPEEMTSVVTALDAAGLQVHVHAIGDRAVRLTLDAIEAARVAHGCSGLRHQIAHAQLVAPGDRSRFRELGVIPNLQGMWVPRSDSGTAYTLQHLDDERARWNYPFRDLADGTVPAGGSDWPVNQPEPLEAVHAMVNRAAYSPDGDPEEPLEPGQALSVEQALAAYTSGSAHASNRHDSGVLRIGARADLVWLDRDIVTGPVDEIAAATVRRVWALGDVVHEA